MKRILLATVAALLSTQANAQTQFPASTLWGNVTGSTGLPTTVSLPNCATGALNFTIGTGFGCGPGGGGTGTNILPLDNVWTATQQYAGSPNYVYAGGVAAFPITIPLNSSTQTVAVNKVLNLIRLTQTSGADMTFNIGAGGQVAGLYSSLTSGATSNATSAAYAVVAHVDVAGAGPAKAVHGEVTTEAASTGAAVIYNAELNPNGSGSMSAMQIGTVTGTDDKASGILINGGGPRYISGIGGASPGSVAPNFLIAAYIAWMGSGSAAGARAFQLLNNAGSEIAYWHQDGTVHVPGITMGSATSNCSVDSTGILNCTSTGTNFPVLIGENTAANAGSAQTIMRKQRAGGSVINADTIATWSGQAFNAGNYQSAAILRVFVDGTPGATFVPSRWDFTTGTSTAAFANSLVFNSAGHLDVTLVAAGPSVAAGCTGAGSAITGTDMTANVTGSTAAATNCTVAWGTAYAAAPKCVVSGWTGPVTVSAVSTTGITVNFASTANFKWSYVCHGT